MFSQHAAVRTCEQRDIFVSRPTHLNGVLLLTFTHCVILVWSSCGCCACAAFLACWIFSRSSVAKASFTLCGMLPILLAATRRSVASKSAHRFSSDCGSASRLTWLIPAATVLAPDVNPPAEDWLMADCERTGDETCCNTSGKHVINERVSALQIVFILKHPTHPCVYPR